MMVLRILRALIVLRYLEIISRPPVLEALTVNSKAWHLGSKRDNHFMQQILDPLSPSLFF